MDLREGCIGCIGVQTGRGERGWAGGSASVSGWRAYVGTWNGARKHNDSARVMTVRVVRRGRKGVVEHLARASKGRGWHRRRRLRLEFSRARHDGGVMDAAMCSGRVRSLLCGASSALDPKIMS